MPPRTIILGAAAVGIVAVVGLLAFLVGMNIGGGGQEVASQDADDEKQKTSAVEDTQGKQTVSKLAPRMRGVAQVGETAEMVDRFFTVNDVQRGWVFPHNIPKPDVGNEFVIVNLTVTNTSEQPIKVHVWEFESEDSNGVGRKATATTQVPNAIPPWERQRHAQWGVHGQSGR